MSFSIAGRHLGANLPAFIILEVGINHNGNLDQAYKLICKAKEVGADAVKFQTFKTEEFIADRSLMFTYRSQGQEITEPMFDTFKRVEFSESEWRKIKRMCDEQNICFFSTPQNSTDKDLLLDLGVPALKIGSDDFTNLPLIEEYSTTDLPLLLSCGMADLGEVYDALRVSRAMQGRSVALMLCTSQYPTPSKDVNLRKLSTLSGAFPFLTLGLSDHTQGTIASSVARGLGACIFEKHFTLDHDLPGPDHWFSENPKGAKDWVSAIRATETMLGSPIVEPTAAEWKMRQLARRSVTTLTQIEKGEAFTETNLGLKRPGDGLSPKWLPEILGRRSTRTLTAGLQIDIGDVE